MKITNSMIKSYQHCKRQYNYKFVEQLIPKHKGLPLYRGSWLHELLEAKYAGGDWRSKNDELAETFHALFAEEREMYGDLPSICEKIMESYDYHWRKEDESFNVIEVETEHEVDLPHGHTLKFRIDAVIEDEYGRWLMEHKSHKTIPNADYRFMDMQTARYVWGLNEKGYDLTGVLWNYIRTKEPTKPEMTQSGRLSRRRIDTDVLTYVRALKEYGLDLGDHRDDILRLKHHNTFFRRERVPKPQQVIETLVEDAVHIADEIERGFLPIRSIDRSCEFMCSYLDLCVTSLYGGDVSDIVKSNYQEATSEDYYGYADKPQ